jgi:hypothetical protein
MRTVFRTTLLSAALLLAAGTLWAQDKPGQNKNGGVKPAVGAVDRAEEAGVHRMEIYNGPLRSVHYIYRGLSPSEAQAVRELERAENESTLANEMLALRMQYVSGERGADAQRRFSQQQLYGYTAAESEAGAISYGRRVYPYGYIGSSPFWGGWGMGWGGYGGGGMMASGAFSSADAVGLGLGVGDEGRIKTEMARTVASQATPEYAARASQDLTSAAARASSYPVVRDSLNLSRAPAIAPVDVAVEMELVRDGVKTKVTGKLLREEGDYLIVETPDGKRKAFHKVHNIDITLPEQKPEK